MEKLESKFKFEENWHKTKFIGRLPQERPWRQNHARNSSPIQPG